MKYIFLAVVVLVVVLILINATKIPGMLQKMKAFYGEVIFEMTKVAWPSSSQVVNSTILVGVVAGVLTVMIGFVDTIFGKLALLIFRG